MKELDFSITIVGLGLIGGSYAKAIKNLNPKKIWGIDIDGESIKVAENLGIIDKGYIDPEIPLKKSDIVIICLYPNATINFMKDNMKFFKHNAIITDTAGIKSSVIKEVSEILRDDLDFIGGHPMAGKENKGITFASENIFKDSNYILTPTYKNQEKNIEIIEEIIKKIGCKNITKTSPERHDEIIALTSQLPHIVASALTHNNSIDCIRHCVGGSFRDATRVAMINTQLWTELFMENNKNIVNELEKFENSIRNIKNILINKDSKALITILEESRLKREALN